jgi:hypothetical protein
LSYNFALASKDNNPISGYAIRHTGHLGYSNRNFTPWYFSAKPICVQAYQSGSDWTHSVVDIGAELVDDSFCGIPENKRDQVGHVDIFIYTFSAGFVDGDAILYVDDLSVVYKSVSATINIDPDTLNIKSKSSKNAVTAYIELPEGYDVSDIDVGTVKLSTANGAVQAQLEPAEVGDYGGDGTADLMVKFDREAVIAIVDVGEEVVLTVAGKVGGTDFQGNDKIRVVQEGR